MKVALIHFRMLLKGGLETRLFSYIDYFKRRGDEVYVIVSRISPDIEIPEGIQLIQIGLRHFPKKWRNVIFDRRLKGVMQKHDFDFSLSLGRTSHQDAVLAPGNHLGYLKALNRKPKGYWDRVQIYLDRLAYRKSKIIYAASQMMADEAIQLFGVAPEKVKVLHPPLDLHRFKSDLKAKRESFRAAYNLDNEKTYFLFMSSGHKRKGLPLLLEVFSQLENEGIELLIAGSPEVKTDLKNVSYLGWIKDSQELYAAADITIHPSVYEPYGQIIAESLQCGTPVLISNMVGAKEIVSGNEGRIVEGFKVEDWVEEVRMASRGTLSVEPGFGERMGLGLEVHMEKMLEIWKANP